ncbi:MAG: hypothetical protein HYU39_09920 [Thaumarchaeota archaeon]|nr:hypothetical protein [Nitrososphaerota archaeon]
MKLGRRTYAGVVVVLIAVTALAVYLGYVPNSGQTSQPAVASSVLSDPAADIGNNPIFLDVVSARVVRSESNLLFSATMSSEIPKTPTSFVAFGWFITSGVTSVNQPIVVLIYDPAVGNWAASIFVGRPPSPSTRGLSFTLEGNVATVSIPLQALGSPESFTWHVVSRTTPFAGTGPGTSGTPVIDRAPDSGDVTWPAT